MTERPGLEKGKLYKLTEVAAILGVDVTTVRRWVRAGEVPAKRIGRLYFIYGGDLVPDRLTKQGDALE